MKPIFSPLKTIMAITCVALIANSCKKEDEPLVATPSDIFVTVKSQVTADITGTGDNFASISSRPDGSIAAAAISANVLFVNGVGVGNTSVTVESEGAEPVTIPIVVAASRFDRGWIWPVFDGQQEFWGSNMVSWDSLGTFFLEGASDNLLSSISIEGAMILNPSTGNTGTFSLIEGKVRYSKNGAQYHNTGTSFDQLVITSYTNDRVIGNFYAILARDSDPSQTITMSKAEFEMFF